MKSIKNASVLNTWVLLVDFRSMNTGLSSQRHPRKSCSFVLSWSAAASATRAMKAHDTKRTSKANFPNFPAVRPKAEFFEPRQLRYQNAPILTQISKIADLLGNHTCVTRHCVQSSLPDSLEIRLEFFCKQTRNRHYSNPKGRPFSFSDCPETLTDYNDAQYVKLPYSV